MLRIPWQLVKTPFFGQIAKKIWPRVGDVGVESLILHSLLGKIPP
jgi:hypothetical protein